MILINLFGGLGNQLFQLAAAYALSKIKKKEIYIDDSLTNYFKFSHEKINLNEIFELNIKKKNNISYIKILIKKLILKYKTFSYIQKLFISELNYSKVVTNEFLKIEMVGYWQDLNYFNKYKKEIIKLFKFKKFEININLLNQILKTNSVSIHIRRGDFISKKNTVSYGLPINYYKKAIRSLYLTNKNINFFIFTDDKSWVEDNFLQYLKKFNYNLVTTDKNYKDFFLMSKCKHNIISNSTFSWWAAFLNENKNKLVFYPKNWYKNNMKSPNIFDSKWIKL
jgi:hypothetical protein